MNDVLKILDGSIIDPKIPRYERKDLICCHLTNPITMQSNPTGYETIPFTELTKIGNGFTLQSDGSIKIDPKIKTIKISYTLNVVTAGTNQARYIRIYTNDNTTLTWQEINANASGNTTFPVSFGPLLVELDNVDTISVKYYLRNGDSIATGYIRDFLLIEAVEYK